MTQTTSRKAIIYLQYHDDPLFAYNLCVLCTLRSSYIIYLFIFFCLASLQ